MSNSNKTPTITKDLFSNLKPNVTYVGDITLIEDNYWIAGCTYKFPNTGADSTYMVIKLNNDTNKFDLIKAGITEEGKGFACSSVGENNNKNIYYDGKDALFIGENKKAYTYRKELIFVKDLLDPNKNEIPISIPTIGKFTDIVNAYIKDYNHIFLQIKYRDENNNNHNDSFVCKFNKQTLSLELLKLVNLPNLGQYYNNLYWVDDNKLIFVHIEWKGGPQGVSYVYQVDYDNYGNCTNTKLKEWPSYRGFSSFVDDKLYISTQLKKEDRFTYIGIIGYDTNSKNFIYGNPYINNWTDTPTVSNPEYFFTSLPISIYDNKFFYIINYYTKEPYASIDESNIVPLQITNNLSVIPDDSKNQFYVHPWYATGTTKTYYVTKDKYLVLDEANPKYSYAANFATPIIKKSKIYIKYNNVWKEASVYIKQQGAWVLSKAFCIKENGVWKKTE